MGVVTSASSPSTSPEGHTAPSPCSSPPPNLPLLAVLTLFPTPLAHLFHTPCFRSNLCTPPPLAIVRRHLHALARACPLRHRPGVEPSTHLQHSRPHVSGPSSPCRHSARCTSHPSPDQPHPRQPRPPCDAPHACLGRPSATGCGGELVAHPGPDPALRTPPRVPDHPPKPCRIPRTAYGMSCLFPPCCTTHSDPVFPLSLAASSQVHLPRTLFCGYRFLPFHRMARRAASGRHGDSSFASRWVYYRVRVWAVGPLLFVRHSHRPRRRGRAHHSYR